MKRLLFTSLSLSLLPLSVGAATLLGDVNGDGVVNVADVARLVSYMYDTRAYFAGVDYVDLGLPSGLLWATANIGATEATDYGTHFAWGETSGKDDYEWSTYAWGTSGTTLTKYCALSGYGTQDGLSTLEPADDAARVCTNSNWHIPSFDDWDELESKCYVWEDSVDGVHGFYFKSKKNKKSIFLPYSGFRSTDYIYDEGLEAFYWANATYACNSSVAYGYYIGDTYHGWAYRSRYQGNPIRPVIYPCRVTYDINSDGSFDAADVWALVKLTLNN